MVSVFRVSAAVVLVSEVTEAVDLVLFSLVVVVEDVSVVDTISLVEEKEL